MGQPRKPNVLFMVADDQRFDTIRAWGNSEVFTPVLDSLASNGVSLRTMYTSGGLTPALCVPGRSCMLTGAHALTAAQGRQLNHWPDLMTINPDLALMPQTMREAGYHTFATGKWHNDRASFIKGFCDGAKIFFGGMSEHRSVPVYDFDPSGVYSKESRYVGEKFSTDLFTDAAVEFIASYDQERPFFLYLAYTSPHDPRTAPQEFADRYRAEEIALPPNFVPVHPFDNGEMTVRDELLAPSPRPPEEVRQHIADYYAMITHMDDRVGQVLHALEKSGQLENTIIVYTADHGLALGQHGLMGKQNLYDHSIRIPAIVAGPGLPRGKEVKELTCQFDLYPTLCDLIGIPAPQGVEGRSLLPLIRGTEGSPHTSAFTVYKDLQRMVSDGEWKLIRYYRPEEHNYGTDRIQLFHLTQDPWETEDLSEDPRFAGQLQRMVTELVTWQQRVQDPWAYRPALPSPPQEGVWGNWND